MTFNVRYDTSEDGAHDWRHRRADVFDIIRANDPDLLSLQEPDASQWADTSAHLADYTPFGVFDDGSENLEAHGGFFRTSRFDGSTQGIFWLSGTPSIPHSVTWENDWEPRACGWIRLRDRVTNRELVFASTHFDTNAHAWRPSAETLRRELETIAGTTPVIVAGDFNCPAGCEAHGCLIAEEAFRDVWHEAGHADAGVLTFHGFTGRRDLPTGENERIDWILVRGELTCVEAKIDYSSKSGEPASDHYPVIAQLSWSGP
jgi:endonuclease/exonuclease/phosphatase family metal-dependent hydrolase